MHVKLHLERSDKASTLEIDGVDISKYVMRSTLRIEPGGFRSKIHLTLMPDMVDVTGDLEVLIERAQAFAETNGPVDEGAAPQ